MERCYWVYLGSNDYESMGSHVFEELSIACVAEACAVKEDDDIISSLFIWYNNKQLLWR